MLSPRRFSLLLAALLTLALPPAARAQQSSEAPTAGALSDRVTQIEEQMIDLQVVIGTLQSLVARAGATPEGQSPALVGAPGAGDLGARVQVMETQIQALTGQIEQLTRQLAAFEAQLGGAPATAPESQAPDRSDQLSLNPTQPADATPDFGTVTIKPGDGDVPALPAPVESGPAASEGDQVASIRAKALYEDAYGHLLRRDYGAAEAGFRQFLAAHPSDALAGNALYWLAETYYVRGQYSEAAKAFLDGYKRFRGSDKAPDSLLKLGMALQQLGETDTACATLGELQAKFPKAPAHIQKRAASERKRAGC